MANSEAMYSKVPADGEDHQRNNSSRVSKVGIALLAGSCLMAVSFLATSTWSRAAESTQPTSLFGVPASLRSTGKASLMRPQMTANLLPGPSPWKELALAGLQDINRDPSMNAQPRVRAVLAGMSSASRTVVARAQSSVIDKMEDMEAGQLAPAGFFDPLGFSANLDPGKILFYREAELKHGRVSMLAALGFLVGEQFHPLFGGDIDVPSYVAFQAIPLRAFWTAVAVAIAIPESFSISTLNAPVDEDKKYNDARAFSANTDLDRIPGDIGFDPLGLKPDDPEKLLEMQNKELNNGRLAMIGIAGMVAQECITGQKLF